MASVTVYRIPMFWVPKSHIVPFGLEIPPAPTWGPHPRHRLPVQGPLEKGGGGRRCGIHPSLLTVCPQRHLGLLRRHIALRGDNLDPCPP